MALIQVQILTHWNGSGSDDDPYRPRIADDYQLVSCTDATGQPVANLIPSPNTFVVEVFVDDFTLTQIEADANYGPGAILWSKPQP
jgi:hypothetical protein